MGHDVELNFALWSWLLFQCGIHVIAILCAIDGERTKLGMLL